VDEGNAGGGGGCSTGQLGVCDSGTSVCQSGSLSCQQNTSASPETCDGLDNDCDGVVDNGNPGGGAVCSTGLPGVCDSGTSVCQSGSLSCQQNTSPSAETCNGLDDDCDGLTDEGGVCSVCGNGVVEPGEQCDDGNTNDFDDCTNACLFQI